METGTPAAFPAEEVPCVQAQYQSEQRHLDQDEMGGKKVWQKEVGH
jgi:hypothetical protein